MKPLGAAFPNDKKSFPRLWPVSINLAARLNFTARRRGP